MVSGCHCSGLFHPDLVPREPARPGILGPESAAQAGAQAGRPDLTRRLQVNLNSGQERVVF